MKRSAILAGVALACLSVAACANAPKTDTISIHVDATTADAAAVKFEIALGVFADTLAIAVTDPHSGLDPKALAVDVPKAKTYLDQGRTAFDSRSGDVNSLATQALDIISGTLPATASPKVRTALLGARLAVALYGAEVASRPSASVAPSDALVSARKSTDAAITRLIAVLPSGGG